MSLFHFMWNIFWCFIYFFLLAQVFTFKNQQNSNTMMRKILFFWVVAGILSFAACNNASNEKVGNQQPIVEQCVIDLLDSVAAINQIDTLSGTYVVFTAADTTAVAMTEEQYLMTSAFATLITKDTAEELDTTMLQTGKPIGSGWTLGGEPENKHQRDSIVTAVFKAKAAADEALFCSFNRGNGKSQLWYQIEKVGR